MSASRWSRRIIGGVCYITHAFDEIGDELAPHSHAGRPELTHTTLIAKGSVEILGRRAGQVANAGDLVEWAPDEEHGLRALTSGAVAVNVRRAIADEIGYPRPNGETPD